MVRELARTWSPRVVGRRSVRAGGSVMGRAICAFAAERDSEGQARAGGWGLSVRVGSAQWICCQGEVWANGARPTAARVPFHTVLSMVSELVLTWSSKAKTRRPDLGARRTSAASQRVHSRAGAVRLCIERVGVPSREGSKCSTCRGPQLTCRGLVSVHCSSVSPGLYGLAGAPGRQVGGMPMIPHRVTPFHAPDARQAKRGCRA